MSARLGVVLVLLVSCSPPVSTVRMGGVFPPRPSDCQLELRAETLSYEVTSTYDTVGAIMVRGEPGEVPNAPRLLAMIKPEACGLGGELVMINTSMNVQVIQGPDASHHSYLVMRYKSKAPSRQTF